MYRCAVSRRPALVHRQAEPVGDVGVWGEAGGDDAVHESHQVRGRRAERSDPRNGLQDRADLQDDRRPTYSASKNNQLFYCCCLVFLVERFDNHRQIYFIYVSARITKRIIFWGFKRRNFYHDFSQLSMHWTSATHCFYFPWTLPYLWNSVFSPLQFHHKRQGYFFCKASTYLGFHCQPLVPQTPSIFYVFARYTVRESKEETWLLG